MTTLNAVQLARVQRALALNTTSPSGTALTAQVTALTDEVGTITAARDAAMAQVEALRAANAALHTTAQAQVEELLAQLADARAQAAQALLQLADAKRIRPESPRRAPGEFFVTESGYLGGSGSYTRDIKIDFQSFGGAFFSFTATDNTREEFTRLPTNLSQAFNLLTQRNSPIDALRVCAYALEQRVTHDVYNGRRDTAVGAVQKSSALEAPPRADAIADRLPCAADALAVLLRFCIAANIPTANLKFHGKLVNDWSATDFD